MDPPGALGFSPGDESRPGPRRAVARRIRRRPGPLVYVLRHLPGQLPRRGWQRTAAVESERGENQAAGARRRCDARDRSRRARGKRLPGGTRGRRRTGSRGEHRFQRQVAQLSRRSGHQ